MRDDKIYIDGKPYILGPYLASGLIGVVFPAFAEDDLERKKPVFAVKVPASSLTQNLKSRFWQEFDVLEATNRKWLELHPEKLSPFPQTQKANRAESEVLAMEFVPDETIISRVLNDEDSLKREQQYVSAALQYARMLQVLHQAGYICPDRKTDDVRWLAEQARLVVLDWNVVEPLKSPGIDEKQEYAIFGSLWYQYLTGKVPSGAMSLLDDSAWGGLTLGIREILDGLMRGRYQTDDALLDSFEAWHGLLENDQESLFTLLPEESSAKENVDMWWERLKLLDLVRRYAPDLYEAQYQDFVEKFVKRANRIFFDAQFSLLRGKPEEGLSFLKRIRDGLWQGKDSALKLMWARWHVLMQAALEYKQKNESFLERGKIFQAWFEAIDQHSHSREEFWKGENPDFPKGQVKLSKFLNVFGIEMAIQQEWKRYVVEIPIDSYAQRHLSIEKIEKWLENIKEIDADYYQALREDALPGFDIEKRKLDLRLTGENKFSNLDALVGQESEQVWRKYLLFRIQDAFSDQQWQERMRLLVEDLDALHSFLSEGAGKGISPQTVRTSIINMLNIPEVGRTFSSEFTEILLDALKLLPFSEDERGLEERLSLIQGMRQIKNGFLEPICLEYEQKAIAEIERLLDASLLEVDKANGFLAYLSDYQTAEE